jgi:hypothetical protein
METVLKNASVKIMLSYDYSHFEVAMSIENESGLLLKDIDDARKNCQRLADKAVSQYKKAKEKAALRTDGKYKIQNFENQCRAILAKPEGDRTINEAAMLKEYSDENWRSRFYYDYDYEDEDENNYRDDDENN